MKITRREFIERNVRGGLAVGAAVAWAPEGTMARENVDSGDADRLPIVDTHQHLWDLGKIHPPWLKAGGELTRDYVTRDYLDATRGLNVVKAVYMEVAVADEDLVGEAELVLELCQSDDHPTCAAVIGGRPAADDFSRYIGRYKNNPYVKGVRHILRKQEMLEAPGLVPGLRLLGELGMSFDLCVSPSLLAQGAKLLDRCLDTRFILDHCGNADPNQFHSNAPEADRRMADAWKRDMAALARRKNIVCKISGIVARMTKGEWRPEDLAPVVNHCLDEFGPDRVMFASDWPVCTRGATLRQWVTGLEQIVQDRPIEERKKLFGQNASAFYELG